MPLVHQPVLWIKQEFIKIINAKWLMNEPRNQLIKGICITPELCQDDYVYIAAGKHSVDKRIDLLIEAFNKGVSAAIVDKEVADIPQWAPVLLVDNAEQANALLALDARNKSRATIIAVTGSVGKTSTKNIIAELLSNQALTYSNYKSINGGPGLKTQIANISKAAQFCVMEFGMKGPNTIRPMSNFLRPHIGLITAIAPAHYSYHENMESIIKTKSQVVDGIAAGGHVVLPRDSEYFEQLYKYVKTNNQYIHIHTFGQHQESNVQLISYQQNGTTTKVNALVFGTSLSYEIAMHGYLWVINSIAALACIALSGANIVHAAQQMCLIQPVFRRGERFRVNLKSKSGIIEVIDDTWNASPMAMREAISMLSSRKLSYNTRRVVVLGDMAELGDNSETFHKGLIDIIREINIGLVCTVGQHMLSLHNIIPKSIEKYHAESIRTLLPKLESYVKNGDSVLVKGSNSMHMYKVVQHFIGNYDTPRAPKYWSLYDEVNKNKNKIEIDGSSRFDTSIVDFMNEHNIAGAAVVISQDNKIIKSKGYGYANLEKRTKILPNETQFRLFSITKPITATAILILIEQDKLNLEDFIFTGSGILSDYKVLDGETFNEDLRHIKLIHLLQHSAGWSIKECKNPFNNKSFFDPMFNLSHIARETKDKNYATKENAIRYMLSQALQHKPGEKYVYSNFGYNVLGRIIEKVSGLSYYDFIKQNIFIPLGINNIELAHTKLKDCSAKEAYYYPRKEGHYTNAIYDKTEKVTETYGSFCIEEIDALGGLIGTTEDVLNFALNFDNLLSKDIFNKIHQKPDLKIPNTSNWYYGLGWRVTPTANNNFNLWHRGFVDIGGAASFMVRASSEKKASWMVSFNKSVSVSKIEVMMKHALNHI
ncbi:MAG: serine hydrolase [Gammaproteobacteria bacterium]|nr:serine hydrolase [Gammaproteobacteria bacterium]